MKKHLLQGMLYLLFCISTTQADVIFEPDDSLSTTSLSEDQEKSLIQTTNHILEKKYASTLIDTEKSIQNGSKLEKKESNKAAEAEWNIMLYIQAKNNLYSAAVENLHQIAQTFDTDKVALYIQWYQPHHEGFKRYKIEQKKIILLENHDNHTDNHTADALINFVRWSTAQTPAKKYACILWNHGLGYIDPEWNNSMRIIQNPLEMNQGNRIHLDGMVESFYFDNFDAQGRGILFDEYRRVYMNNQELAKAFRVIKTDILKNKKLDLLGMDACYMMMAEVAHQIAPYAQYFVASEDVELAQGWNYIGILQSIMKNPSCHPAEFAESIVKTYESLYRGKTNLFTQSAINLDAMETIKEKFSIFTRTLLKNMQLNSFEIKNLVHQARSRCQQFSMQTYIDLKSFCEELQKSIHSSGHLKALDHSLGELIAALNEGIIAKTSSTYFSRAYGLSIYFPLYRIDRSYFESSFAQETNWLQIIGEHLLM